MPSKPPTACSTPSCGGTACNRGKCESCQPLLPLVHETYANKILTRPWHKLYNSVRWRKLRDAILRRDPVCEVCKRKASAVADHRIDHKGDLELFYDPQNLRGVCKPCHDYKTGRTSGGGRDGNPAPGDRPYMVGGLISDPAEQLAKQEGSARQKR